MTEEEKKIKAPIEAFTDKVEEDAEAQREPDRSVDTPQLTGGDLTDNALRTGIAARDQLLKSLCDLVELETEDSEKYAEECLMKYENSVGEAFGAGKAFGDDSPGQSAARFFTDDAVRAIEWGKEHGMIEDRNAALDASGNVEAHPMKASKSQDANWAGWERAYKEWGSKLGLADPEAYIILLGQVSHESGGFKWMEEFASGKAYEGRSSLGNVVPGDGVKYKGRGPIQVTGRANYTNIYQKFLCRIGMQDKNIVDMPAIVAGDPYIGALVTMGWLLVCNPSTIRHCNAHDIRSATKAINGGYNGLDDRVMRTNKIMAHYRQTGEITPFVA